MKLSKQYLKNELRFAKIQKMFNNAAEPRPGGKQTYLLSRPAILDLTMPRCNIYEVNLILDFTTQSLDPLQYSLSDGEFVIKANCLPIIVFKAIPINCFVFPSPDRPTFFQSTI